MTFKLTKILSLIFVCAASVASAQTIDPHVVEFDPSLDHYTTLPTGQPVVDRYDLHFYYSGAAQPFQVMDLGKPTPETDGKIRVDFFAYLLSWPLPGIVYEARVAAVGPAGTTLSVASNPFSFSGSCAYDMTPNSLSFSASAGTGSVNVWSGPACTWTATSSNSWVTVTSSPGSGNGIVTFSVASNPTASPRAATVAAGNAVATINQAAGTAAVATTVTVAPATTAVAVGSTATLTAAVWDQNGQPMPSAAVTWSVTPTGVVTLTPNGATVTVTGAAAGTATVKATSGTVSGTATVTVQAPVATTVTVAPATTTVAIGSPATLTATVRDQNGQPMPSATVTWSVTPTGVVTLTPSGATVTVTGAAAGTATVKATS
ncbi:MAG TPA: Ig-like domain-containing protein, partial [Mycobacterium sp.]|nr:Ig-like domain-containing protein [Mycobacterium sp.]